MDRGVAGRLGRGRQKLPETRLHVSLFSLCPKSSKVMSSGRVSHPSVPPPGTWKIEGSAQAWDEGGGVEGSPQCWALIPTHLRSTCATSDKACAVWASVSSPGKGVNNLSSGGLISPSGTPVSLIRTLRTSF